MWLPALFVLSAAYISAAQPQSGTATCQAIVTLSNNWVQTSNNATFASVNLDIISTQPTIVPVPWTLTLKNAAYGMIKQTFSLEVVTSGNGTIVAQALNYWQTLSSTGGGVAVGLIVQVQVSSGIGMPDVVAVNNQPCVIQSAALPPHSPPKASHAEDASQLTTLNGQIIGLDGQPLTLWGINWFGFEDGTTMVDGLWAGTDSLTLDFATIVYRLQLLGFNAVRLPFSFSDLYDKQPLSQQRNCAQVDNNVVIADTTDPSVTPSRSPPQWAAPPASVPGVCNAYLPEDTTLDRFLWVVNYFTQQGFYIILDNQFNLDQTATSNTPLWLSRWADLMTQLSVQYPDAAAHVICDFLNEPDFGNLRWEAQPDQGLPGMKDMYLNAMDEVYNITSGVLFLVEGCGQGSLGKNWGDGIATDPQIISSRGLSDPNPFFSALLEKPYIDQIIIGPHVYPPSISMAQEEISGESLWARFSASHGYLNKQGYCDGGNTLGSPSGNCHLFPVIWGETGTGFTDAVDQQPMTDMIPYFQNSGAAADGLHNRLSGVFWWAWNSNSGQSLGLVENWSQVDWNKVAYLEALGYTPWWLTPTPPSTDLSASVSPSSPPGESPAASPSSQPSSSPTSPPQDSTTASPSSQPYTPSSYPGGSPAASPQSAAAPSTYPSTSPSSPGGSSAVSPASAAAPSTYPSTSPAYSGSSPAASPEPAAAPSNYPSPSPYSESSPAASPQPAAASSNYPSTSPSYSNSSPAASPQPAAGPSSYNSFQSYASPSPAASPEPAASPSPQPTATPTPLPPPTDTPSPTPGSTPQPAMPPPYAAYPPPPPTPTLPTSASAAGPAQLASPPPPPVAFASNMNPNGGSTAGSSTSETSYSSTIGDVFTYEPKGGGAIESAGPIGPSTTALTVKNGVIVGTDGLPVLLRGIVWGGYQSGTMVEGLQGSSSITADLSTQVTRTRALGFNAVKLPFSFSQLLGSALAPVSTACTTATAAQLQASILPAETNISATAAVPALLALSSDGRNQCNTDVPTTDALDRYVYIVNFLTSNGLYAVLENSFAQDRSAIDNPQGWVQKWAKLVTAITANSVAASRIIISPLGNPDAHGLQWQAAKGLAGLSNIYLAAMDALNQLSPQALFFLQGAGQTSLTTSPGDGYVSDTATLQRYNLSDPSAFFKTLLVRPYVNQVVMTPLYQAPSVTGAKASSSTGAALWQHLTTSFGYLNKEGFCPSSTTCKTFAVVLGGFGSPMTSKVDMAAFADLAAYLQPLCGLPACLAADGAHSPIYSWFWDGWSADSAGAVLSVDGSGVNSAVLAYLVGLGLTPWYLPPSAQKAKPKALDASQLPPTVKADANFCQAQMLVTSAGTDNATGLFLGSVMVTATNVGPVAVPTPWTITIANPYYLGVSQAYGLSQPQYTIGGTLTGVAGDYWDVLWPHATNAVSVGFLILSRSPQQLQPSKVLLNGNKCMVVGPGGGQGPTAGQHLGSLPSSGVQAASLMSPGLNT